MPIQISSLIIVILGLIFFTASPLQMFQIDGLYKNKARLNWVTVTWFFIQPLQKVHTRVEEI